MMPTFTTAVQRCTGSFRQSNRQEKERNSIDIEKEEVKLPLFSENIILYKENAKEIA